MGGPPSEDKALDQERNAQLFFSFIEVSAGPAHMPLCSGPDSSHLPSPVLPNRALTQGQETGAFRGTFEEYLQQLGAAAAPDSLLIGADAALRPEEEVRCWAERTGCASRPPQHACRAFKEGAPLAYYLPPCACSRARHSQGRTGFQHMQTVCSRAIAAAACWARGTSRFGAQSTCWRRSSAVAWTTRASSWRVAEVSAQTWQERGLVWEIEACLFYFIAPHASSTPRAEVPIVDGSALGWATEIQRAGLRPAPGAAGAEVAVLSSAPALQEVRAWMSGGGRVWWWWWSLRCRPGELCCRGQRTLPQAVTVRDGESFITFYPGSTSRVTGAARTCPLCTFSLLWHCAGAGLPTP